MLLPAGCRSPQVAFLVEQGEPGDDSYCQLGGFTTRHEAEACMAVLGAEGRENLYLNFVPLHERLTDWQEDR